MLTRNKTEWTEKKKKTNMLHPNENETNTKMDEDMGRRKRKEKKREGPYLRAKICARTIYKLHESFASFVVVDFYYYFFCNFVQHQTCWTEW